MTDEDDAQTAALREYFKDNRAAGYGAAFRAGWEANRAFYHEQRELAEAVEAENALLRAALEGEHEAVKALLGYFRHGRCDSIASAGEPDCACGLRGKINAAAAMPLPPSMGGAPDDH